MIEPMQLLAFIGFAAILAVTPGPGLPYLAAPTLAVTLSTLPDVVAAFAAARMRAGLATRPTLILRLREASGAIMVALGAGLLLLRRPAG